MVKLRDAHPLLADGSIDIEQWLTRIDEDRSDDEMTQIKRAAYLAKTTGENVLLPLGESCLYQGLIVAEILHQLGLDAPSLIAAIMYDAVRYAQLSLEEVELKLGIEVRFLLEGIQKIDAFSTQTNKHIRQTENLRRMLFAIVEDVRVVLIKLASHTAEMRLSKHLSEVERKQKAEETQEIYAPLANRLGIGQIKWELEDLAFRYLDPEHYKQIAKFLHEKRLDREDYIEEVVASVKTFLLKQDIEPHITGRAKHIYSIWKKMQRKGVSYHEIYDVRAIRILVPTVQDCYAALGVVHSLWQHIPKEFDDYIANPKENGYRSLHTAVIGPDGKTLEIQIRTFEMHEQAELGVAAHWKYKENIKVDSHYENKLNSLRQVLKWQEEWQHESAAHLNEQSPSSMADKLDNLDADETADLNAEVFLDRVYVLTPKGKVMDLPQGATVLDFAYHIHTDVGNRCRGAKINGKMVSLTHTLSSGDRVEILTAKQGGPSRDWLNRDLGYLKTSRARTKAISWFRRQDREHHIVDGRNTLERELNRLGLENIKLDDLSQHLKFSKIEDMFAGIGSGDVRIGQVVGALQQLSQHLLPKALPKSIEYQSIVAKKNAADILVSGMGNVLCQMARCCKPLPGEDIIGYLTIGRGITVHRTDCQNILQADELKRNRFIQVEWGSHPKDKYSVDISIKAYDREGLIRDIASILSSERINVLKSNTQMNKYDHTADCHFSIEISSLSELSKVLTRIQHLPNVIEVKRTQS